MKKEKIAVCITAQTSSQKLIDYGAEVMLNNIMVLLHILRCTKGDSIFKMGKH